MAGLFVPGVGGWGQRYSDILISEAGFIVGGGGLWSSKRSVQLVL